MQFLPVILTINKTAYKTHSYNKRTIFEGENEDTPFDEEFDLIPEMHTSGALQYENDTITLMYKEFNEGKYSKTTIIFKKDKPGEVVFVRGGVPEGVIGGTFVFNALNPCNVCVYGMENIMFDVTITTYNLKNTLNTEKGGDFDVIFSSEYRGMSTGKNRLKIHAEPIEN